MNTTAAHKKATRIWNALIFCWSISAGTFTSGAAAAGMGAPPVRQGRAGGSLPRRALGIKRGLDRQAVVHPAQLLRRNRGADRAAHAGAGESAIAHRVLGEILLMIVLGEIERRRVADLGGDLAVALRPQRLGVGGFRGLTGRALRGIEGVDARAILRADVVALAHALGRVVVLPERLEQPLVGDSARVENHQHDLVVPGAPVADSLAGRIGGDPAGLAGRRDEYILAELPKLAL